MGWETRERGGRYYTRSRKVGGRVVREYVGGGAAGELAAAQDAMTRRRRDEEAATLRAMQEREAGALAALSELGTLLDGLAAALLVGNGFHRHKRGEWRRKRRGAHAG